MRMMRLAHLLALVPALLCGCAAGESERRPAPDEVLATAGPKQVALLELDAAEAADAKAVARLWHAEEPWAQRWVAFHADALAAQGRGWRALRQVTGDGREAQTFLYRQFTPGIEDLRPQPTVYWTHESLFDTRRDEVRGQPLNAMTVPITDTPAGLRLDATLPPPGTDPDRAATMLLFFASQAGRDLTELLYSDWIARRVGAGADDLDDLRLGTFRATVSPERAAEVAGRARAILSDLHGEAERRDLAEVARTLAAVAAELDAATAHLGGRGGM